MSQQVNKVSEATKGADINRFWFNFFSVSLFGSDFIAVSIAAFTALYWKFGDISSRDRVLIFGGMYSYTSLLIIFNLMWLLYFYISGAYKPFLQFEGSQKDGVLFSRSTYFVFGLGFLFFVFHASFSRIAYGVYSFFCLFLIFTFRTLLRQLVLNRLQHVKRVGRDLYVVGTDLKVLEDFVVKLEEQPRLGYNLIAIQAIKNNVSELDGLINQALLHNEYSEFLVLSPSDGLLSVNELVNYLSQFHLSILVYPTVAMQESYINFLVRGVDSPFFTIKASRIDRTNGVIKRAFDIVFSLVVLVVGAPLWLLLVLVMLLAQGWPIFYVSQRVGINKEVFSFLKFRTMVKNADVLKSTVENHHGDGHVLFKNPDDPRITKIGKLLRRFSLDELPQFVNVLKGDMSVVGPRPALPDEVEKYSELGLRRLGVKPGVTGPWQVSGRADLPWDRSLTLDLNYAMTWSFKNDVWLIFRTIGVMITGKGAY